MFPEGRFRAGRAVVRTDLSHVTRDGMRGHFQDLETLAGVPHVQGRGWYGIRRTAIDLTRKITTDARVLDAVHANSDQVRKDIYALKETPETLAAASAVRVAYRAALPPENT